MPLDGVMGLRRNDVSVQDDAALMATESVPVFPTVNEDGPESDAVPPEESVTSVRASSLAPHAFVACPE